MVRVEEGSWDEVPGSKDADICFPFHDRFIPLSEVKRGRVQFMREITSESVMSIVLQEVLPVQGAAKQTRDGCLAAAGAYRSAARPPVSGVRAVPLTIAGERNTFAPGDQRVVQRWICYRVLSHSVASRRFLPVRVMAFLERRSHLQTHHDDKDHRG